MSIYSPSLSAAEVKFCVDNGMVHLSKWLGSSGFKVSYLTEEDLKKVAAISLSSNRSAAEDVAWNILVKHGTFLNNQAAEITRQESIPSDKFSLSK